jgi:hypothetical protein
MARSVEFTGKPVGFPAWKGVQLADRMLFDSTAFYFYFS